MGCRHSLQRALEPWGRGSEPIRGPPSWDERGTDAAGVTLPRGCTHTVGPALPSEGQHPHPFPPPRPPFPSGCRLCPPGQQSRRRTRSPRPVRVRLAVQPPASGCPPGPPPARAGAPAFPAAGSCQCGLCPHRLRAAPALRGFSLPRSTQRRVPSLRAGTCWEGTPREPLHEHSDVHRSSSLSLKCQPRRECGPEHQSTRTWRAEAPPSPPAVPEPTGLHIRYKVRSGLREANPRCRSRRQEPLRGGGPGPKSLIDPFPEPWGMSAPA